MNNYRPDFETNFQMPPWLDMDSGESQTPDVSPFVSALKKRMRPQPPVGGVGGAMGGALGGDMMGTMGKASSGGGPKSL